MIFGFSFVLTQKKTKGQGCWKLHT